MKNFLSVFTSLLILVFAIQSCNQPKVDTAKELATIDSLANVKLTAYSDSLNMICMDNIMVLAQARADSMMTAAMKKSSSTGVKPKPKPVANPANPTVTNRPGTTDAAKPTVTDRPGTTDAAKPTITNRPGATNQPATVTPPKL
ncbi:MAG: hypothetical protein KBF32_07110 [Chitinophagales bacterium]|nr:hypothetical protein [Chitinophagaceae bacterium]MBP9883153.1 hypothetical protein [Chitinophagales bacterium]